MVNKILKLHLIIYLFLESEIIKFHIAKYSYLYTPKTMKDYTDNKVELFYNHFSDKFQSYYFSMYSEMTDLNWKYDRTSIIDSIILKNKYTFTKYYNSLIKIYNLSNYNFLLSYLKLSDDDIEIIIKNTFKLTKKIIKDYEIDFLFNQNNVDEFVIVHRFSKENNLFDDLNTSSLIFKDI